MGLGKDHPPSPWNGEREDRERSEMEAAFENTLDPIAGSPATGNPWQESSISLWMVFLEQVENEREQRVPTRLRKYFQVGNDVAFTGQRIRWIQDSPKGLFFEVSQDALMSRRRSQWNETRRRTSIALFRCIQLTDKSATE